MANEKSKGGGGTGGGKPEAAEAVEPKAEPEAEPEAVSIEAAPLVQVDPVPAGAVLATSDLIDSVGVLSGLDPSTIRMVLRGLADHLQSLPLTTDRFRQLLILVHSLENRAEKDFA